MGKSACANKEYLDFYFPLGKIAIYMSGLIGIYM